MNGQAYCQVTVAPGGDLRDTTDDETSDLSSLLNADNQHNMDLAFTTHVH